MTLKKSIILGLLFSSAIAAPALAMDSIIVECSTCETDSQFYNAAKENIVYQQTTIINVMNFENYEVRKLKSSKTTVLECEDEGEPDGRGGTFQICKWNHTYSILPMSVTNEELNNFTTLADAMNTIRKTITLRSIEIPKIVVGSGYYFITDIESLGKTRIYYNSLPISDNYIEQMNYALSSLSKMAPNALLITAPTLVFKFDDGTKVHAEFDKIVDSEIFFKYTKLLNTSGLEIELEKGQPFKAGVVYNFSRLSAKSWARVYDYLNANNLTVVNVTTRIVPRGNVTIVRCGGTGIRCVNPE